VAHRPAERRPAITMVGGSGLSGPQPSRVRCAGRRPPLTAASLRAGQNIALEQFESLLNKYRFVV